MVISYAQRLERYGMPARGRGKQPQFLKKNSIAVEECSKGDILMLNISYFLLGNHEMVYAADVM